MTFIKYLARTATVTSLTYRILFTTILIGQIVRSIRKR
jgi:hypothetical protein